MQPTNEDGTPAQPRKLIELMPLNSTMRVFRMGECQIIFANEMRQWHISVTCEQRYPTWDELRDIGWALVPGKKLYIEVPTQQEPYLNAHPFCLHMWSLVT